MAGLGGGRAAMDHEVSAKELEVARLLVMLPRLVWEADHGPPCTHNLRWGSKKRRSACADDDAAAPAPPPPRPAAPANQSKKRTREAAAAPKEPLRKEARREGLAAAAVKHPDESGAAAAAAAAAMGTSSPETPLDFCPSAEEADATAKALACPPDPARPPAKKPRLKHEYLSKQVDQLNSTRTELQKEAVEIRKRLEALRARNSELLELRIKMEEERKQQRPPRDCVDLLPAGPGQPAPAPLAPGRVHPQAQPPPQQQQLQQYQQSWPQHWANNRVMFHQVAPGFSLHAPPPPAAESQGWSWASAQTGRADGGGGGSRPGKVMDLLSGAGLDLTLESQQQQHPQQQLQQQQQQQNNYYYQQQQEQKAARKKRIQMMQQRRNAAAAAGGAGVKVASFR